MKAPVRVAVTGAAGQIGYALLFRIASGEMLGKDQPVILQMLELPLDKAQAALKGVMMELEDCAFPLLAGMVGTDDAEVAFKDADYALLVGARPRGPGMERKDLLLENAKIFTAQGAALNKVASRNVKVLVVGNPANTNAYIAMMSAPDLPAKNWFQPGGGAASFVNVAGAGVLGDRAEAVELVRWLLSGEAQRYFADETFEYPLVPGVAAAADLPPLDGLVTPDLDFGAVSAVLEETLAAIDASGLARSQ